MLRKNMVNVIKENVWQEMFDIYLVNKNGIIEHMYIEEGGFNTRCDTKYNLDAILKSTPLYKRETKEETFSPDEGRDVTTHYVELYFYVDNKKTNMDVMRDTSEIESRLEKGLILKTFKCATTGDIIVRLNDDLYLQGKGKTIAEACNKLEHQYCKLR